MINLWLSYDYPRFNHLRHDGDGYDLWAAGGKDRGPVPENQGPINQSIESIN